MVGWSCFQPPSSVPRMCRWSETAPSKRAAFISSLVNSPMLLGCCFKHQLAQRGCVNGIHNCQARKSQAEPGHQSNCDFHVFWELTRIIRLRGGRNTSIRWETNDFLSDQHFALWAYVERQRSFSLVSKLIRVCKKVRASRRLGTNTGSTRTGAGSPSRDAVRTESISTARHSLGAQRMKFSH